MMQRLCHRPPHLTFVGSVFGAALIWANLAAQADSPVNDYPTQARVEYVNDCIAKQGGKLSSLYQCSCVIDRIANNLSYDEFVEASTYFKYAGLPGEGGAIFRDSDQAKKMAKRYRELTAEAYHACGLEP